MRTASGWGVARLKENLVELEKLLEVFGRQEIVNLEQTMVREINLSADL